MMQNSLISDCGFWDGMIWNWSLVLCREFLLWELDMLQELQVMLNQVVLDKDKEDKSIWIHHSSSVYSVKSPLFLRPTFGSLDTGMYNYTNKVWKSVAPLKAELLVWFVLLGRLNTNDRLSRLDIINNFDVKCVLCNDLPEEVDHLFFTCQFTWRIWSACCEKWGLKWVMPNDPRLAYESWLGVGCRKSQRRKWLS